MVTCAATSRELAHVADRVNHLYLLDAMGLAGSVATGLSLALADTDVAKVVTIEGDGSLLMNPNVLPTGGYLKPEKLLVILLDNGVYGSTLNVPTYARNIDLGTLAAAAGWNVLRADGVDSLRSGLAEAISTPGPVFLHVRIEVGNATDVAKLLANPVVIGSRFSSWLAGRTAGATAR